MVEGEVTSPLLLILTVGAVEARIDFPHSSLSTGIDPPSSFKGGVLRKGLNAKSDEDIWLNRFSGQAQLFGSNT